MQFFTDEIEEIGVPLDLDHLTDDLAEQVGKRLISRGFTDWAQQAERVHFCARPIHLKGGSQTVDRQTGEILSSFGDSSGEGTELLLPCGNRRKSKCPACSRLYARDMFEMIRTGMLGGKNVPEQVRNNPTIFLTLTAPSFGSVHGKRPNNQACKPRSTMSLCRHGRPTGCFKKHQDGDAQLGQPLCSECYDYASHVVWQYYSPELWRRFTIQLRRTLAQSLGIKISEINEFFSLQFAKVAEFQERGCIHFHALIRVDGPKLKGEFAESPSAITSDVLKKAALSAAQSIKVVSLPITAADPPRLLRFGNQIDVKIVTNERPNNNKLSAQAVAGYIAKYSTKSADSAFAEGKRNAHFHRLMSCIQEIGNNPNAHSSYGLLRKWVKELGFRGHFATKSRSYSITLGRLRRARKRFRLLAQSRHVEKTKELDKSALSVLLLSDELEEELPIVIGDWQFISAGWANRADEELAMAAAQAAMKYA